jgi:DNA-binding MarR family transcriptional regulator
MPAETLPRLEDCNCFAVRSAARHVGQFYDQFLAPIGLRTTQFSILAKLKQRGPLTINALADDMVMDRTTLGRNVLPLERDGLILIEPIASDRRAKELHPTNTGEKRLQAALKAWSPAQAQFEATFGAKRAGELRALLRSVVASEFTSTTQSAKTDRIHDMRRGTHLPAGKASESSYCAGTFVECRVLDNGSAPVNVQPDADSKLSEDDSGLNFGTAGSTSI